LFLKDKQYNVFLTLYYELVMIPNSILVTGAKGQLGSELQLLAERYPQYQFLFTDIEELSIDDENAVRDFFRKYPIGCCINCAAYTAVDKAETDPTISNSINGDAPGILAAVCKAFNAAFIHISTDYVFDGTATVPYQETDAVSPVNLYGASKLLGEQLALKNNPDTIIIRTSWVYAPHGNNFVKTMLRLMKERDSLNVVSDQQGCPTYAADLASAIMQIVVQLPNIKSERPYIFHYSNQGPITWHHFAETIAQLSGSACEVHPIPTSAYPTPAKRPAYSVMNTQKIQSTFNITIPYWKDSLEICLKRLGV
jgi:dTDP-4-dehydrorhamnose reductase